METLALRFIVTTLLAASLAFAQFPSKPQDTIIKHFDNYSISYKRTTICETQAKAWSGYVHMPGSYLGDLVPQNETISLFFWYFQARHDPRNAQTAIYLAGGPGQTSMWGVAVEGGPCYVMADSKSTEDNPWSWNEYANMLYIDQPIGAGFSYNEVSKSTYDLLGGIITPFSAYGDDVPEQNAALLHGKFSSQDPGRTANTTEGAARMLWHFAQAWFSDFPEYNTCDKRVSLWGNSYGGYWVPASAAYFRKQNKKIQQCKIEGKVLDVSQIGITNGCIDMAYQVEWYPQMAYNNTSDLQVINETVYEAALQSYCKSGEGKEKIEKCRKLAGQLDPDNLGFIETVNAACLKAQKWCTKNIIGAFDALSQVEPRSAFDISQTLPDPYPPPYLSAYFNTAHIHRDLGVPLNLTSTNQLSLANFFQLTGDSFARAGMRDLEFLLAEGVRVTLVYGDRDYRCPWRGAEKLSLAAGSRGV